MSTYASLTLFGVFIQDIPSTGLDDWFELEGRSSRSNIEGHIRLKLQLATREDKGYSEEDNWMDIQEHENLICVFIEYELRKFQVSYACAGHCSPVVTLYTL